jgi:hypothetical protein
MFQTKFVEKIKTHIYVPVIFSRDLRHHVEKHVTTNQVTDDKLRRRKGAICMLDN